MSQQIQIKSKLAGNPRHKPQFSKLIQTHQGEPIEVVDPVATRALIALMDMYAVLGGAASHYGGPAAFAELASATFGLMFSESQKKAVQWHEMFHFVNDAGHCENGLYALKANYGYAGLKLSDLKKFRSIESGLTGHGEVHCWPEGVFLSNGPLGSSLPQAQGLAMAEALSANPRTTLTFISDGALMEGEAKEALSALPGFASKNKLAPFVLVISDNNTKLSGRIDQDSFSLQPTLKSLEASGWEVLSLKEGNDLQSAYSVLEKAIERAQKNPLKPVVIHAQTLKGIGTKKTAESASGGHGFPLKSPLELPAFLKEIYSGSDYPALFNDWISELIEIEKSLQPDSSGQKIQVGVANALIAARKDGLPVVSITSDLPGSTGLAAFRKEFPEASWDVGIAESNMISVASGFSKVGYIPVVDTFAQFGVTKGALPLIMASLSEAPLIGIFSHTGFQDAADGASHQSLSYIAMTSAIPYVKVYNLSCSDEAQALISEAIKQFKSDRDSGKIPFSYLFFLGRENFPKQFSQSTKFSLSSAQVLREKLGDSPNAVTILTQGSLVGEALKAADQLGKLSIETIILNHPSCSDVDGQVLKSSLKQTSGRMVVVEDHQMRGGLASIVAQWAATEGLSLRLKVLAVDGVFGQSAYTSNHLYQKHQMDSASIVLAAKNLLKN